MTSRAEIDTTSDVTVSAPGELPGAADYARRKIGDLARRTGKPVLHARVRLTKARNPAVSRAVIAQANLDVNGRAIRAQVEGQTAEEAIDLLAARLRRRLERIAEHWEARRGKQPITAPHEWRHESEPTHRPAHFDRPFDERQVVRRKSFTAPACTLDEAAWDMEMLDYDFHLFIEEGTGLASVLYRDGSNGYRLAQVVAPSADQLAPFTVPVTLSAQPAPCMTVEQAIERMELRGLPFLFFIEAAQGRAVVLYHRYDGHYGLISLAE
nr:sigma 54 modulation/S30EA ribosomal C-terminal domain-containing protein [Mycolicibacterium komanii]CRL76612.1 ribosome-associated protein [Mycolicibacterium komanii]